MKLKLVSFQFFIVQISSLLTEAMSFPINHVNFRAPYSVDQMCFSFLGYFTCIFGFVCGVADEYHSITLSMIPCMHLHLKSVAFCLLCVCVYYMCL